VTISLGVAQYPLNGEGAEAVIAAADGALYDAKRAGRNKVAQASPRTTSGKSGR
jgi:PleD family two-component response regulator